MRLNFHRLNKFLRCTLASVLLIVFLLFVYWQSLPRKYDLHIGQVSPYDITASHNLIDKNATRLKAISEASAVSPIFTRSEAMSAQCLAKLDEYLSMLYNLRLPVWQDYAEVSGEKLKDNLVNALADFNAIFPDADRDVAENKAETEATEATATTKETATANQEKGVEPSSSVAKDAESALTQNVKPEVKVLTEAEKKAIQAKVEASYPKDTELKELAKRISSLSKNKGIYIAETYAHLLAEAEPSVFMSLIIELRTTAKSIMSQDLNKEKLDIAITHKSAKLVETVKNYTELYSVTAPILRSILAANLRYDAQVTREARNTVYERAMANPIQIHRGTRIVNYNDVISESQYENLKQLGLLKDADQNYQYLFVLLAMAFVCLGLSVVYLSRRTNDYSAARGSNFILTTSAVAVIICSLYTAKISTFLLPIPFFILISLIYFNTRDSLFLTMVLISFLSILSDNTVAHFVGYTVAALIMLLIMSYSKQKNNYLLLIIASSVAMIIGGAFYAVFEYQTLMEAIKVLGFCLLNGLLCALVTIGVVPLFDFTFAAVSPMRLVALAQPDAPLMKRLFMEALGTYQHSMMVANLAETAAEAVGANTLLCRVGAYYHDIGKLEQPLMFTENQDDYNPHDDLQPESSYQIITRHVLMGQKMAKRYRLPQALQNIIKEHHGTTVLFYFYKKAEKEHQKLNLPPVDKANWRYPWQTPSSKEAAIVMLADSLEAAMKSTGYRTVQQVEEMARKIVHDKNSQDQLIHSGLSYQDVEDILQAFKRVYAGVFKERVKYPDVSKS